jgi:uncharacterized membrane protein YfcA
MSLEIMAYSALVIWFAYLVFGLTGYGSGLVAVPILAHFVPLQFAVPYILVLNVSASIAMLSKQDFRRQTNWRELLPLLPFGIAGMIAGTFLLLNLPQGWLLLGLGMYIFVIGVRNLLGIRGDHLISKLWAVPAGLLGGASGALFSASGPPYVIYLTHRLRDPAQLRSSLSALIMLESGLRLVIFLFAGLMLQESIIPALLLAFPLMWFGLYIGNRIHLGVSKHQLLKIIGMLLTASGFSLFFRSDVLYKLF